MPNPSRRPSKTRLSHVDGQGRVRMVDVGAKAETAREAVATGPSSPVRFCLPSSIRSFCLSWLVSMLATVVIDVIFLMPSASSTLLGSSTSIGVCSR